MMEIALGKLNRFIILSKNLEVYLFFITDESSERKFFDFFAC